MKFRTEVEIEYSEKKINPCDAIFSIGSCFATEMSEKLKDGQLQTLNNPFGVLFNPFAVNQAIQNIYSCKNYREEDLIVFDEYYISFDHHTSFDTRFAHQTLEKINQNIEQANQFLQNTQWVIITYGTSFVYEFLPKNKLVSNCHKIPQKYFNKRFLTHTELTQSIAQSIEKLNDIAKENLQILFTISPVRHTKDGIVENNLSKAKLINALHEVLPNYQNCHYLPVYEIMMDDLRDYRFYKDDLVHPNHQAIQYIWEKFGMAYFSDETKIFINENLKIKQALEHRPQDIQNPKYQDFLQKIHQKIVEQQGMVKHKIFDSCKI